MNTAEWSIIKDNELFDPCFKDGLLSKRTASNPDGNVIKFDPFSRPNRMGARNSIYGDRYDEKIGKVSKCD